MLDRILQFIADMLQSINNSLQTLTNSLNNKQDKLTFDTTPKAGSSNPVTSDGINHAFAYLGNKYVQQAVQNQTYWTATTNTAITAANVNTHIKGASVRVYKGIYLIVGQWFFDTGDTTAERNISLDLYAGDTLLARSRVYNSKKNYAALNSVAIAYIENDYTELSVQGSSSMKSAAEKNTISAFRIGRI